MGPECSFSFLHLTLQEYLATLYIAIADPESFDLSREKLNSLVVRFLAGLANNQDFYCSRSFFRRLIVIFCQKKLKGALFVHCAYECPRIMAIVKFFMDQTCIGSYENAKVLIKPSVGLDWYATGYCIGHFEKNMPSLLIVHGERKESNYKIEGYQISSCTCW